MTDPKLTLGPLSEIRMSLFHFNSRTGDEILPDPEGEDLPTLAAAREVALETAREALIEAVKSENNAPDCIQVTDHEGREIMTVFLSELLHTEKSSPKSSNNLPGPEPLKE